MVTGLASARIAGHEDDLSDATRRVRDQEQRDLTDQAHRQAFAIIEAHRDKLSELAESLLRNEVLERNEIDRIMAGVPRRDSRPTPDLRVAAASERPVHDPAN
jgi:cell division protease FtsH